MQFALARAPDDVARLRRFGETIGWAFQVTDDILDVEESSAALGKTAGKDIAQQKATYPAVYGLERSHEIATELAARSHRRTRTLRRTSRAPPRNSRISRSPPRLNRKPPHENQARRKRLDVLLVERGLAESRQKAQAMILAGEVCVNAARPKAGTTVSKTPSWKSTAVCKNTPAVAV